jgi:hypothetical protein
LQTSKSQRQREKYIKRLLDARSELAQIASAKYDEGDVDRGVKAWSAASRLMI